MTQPGAAPLSDGERAFLYDWFAGFLAREPDAAAVAAYRSDEGAAFLAWLESLTSLAILGGALRAAVTETAPDDRVAAGLAAEYARIFHGAGGRASASPCESVHTEGRLEGRAAGEMRTLLRDLDLAPDGAFREPPDHVSVQLAAMAELVRRGDRAAQRAFLDARLLTWLGSLHGTVRLLDRQGLYDAAVGGLLAFARADRTALAPTG